eukprot:Pgem_evm1s14052
MKSKMKSMLDELESLRVSGGDIAHFKSEISSLKSQLNDKEMEVNELNDDLISVEDAK